MNDLVLVNEHTGMAGVVVILEEIQSLFEDASEIETGDGGLDLRWAKQAILDDLINWCKDNMSQTELFNEYVT